MKNLTGFVVATVTLLFLASHSQAQNQIGEKLKQALKLYPEADLNKDGVLSIDEAKTFRSKMRGKKAQRLPSSEPVDTASYEQPADFNEGARCLFMGHSFFIPVAKQFDEIARSSGLPNHHANFVMNGGGGGAPGRIWSSKPHRASATKILEAGNVHLLGMTYYDETNCKVEDYERWIDLAVKHNPKVRVFIGLCWPDAPQAKISEFDRILRVSNERVFNTVQTLRERHPDVPIQFVNYGLVARELKAQHAKGESSEIESLVSREPNSLFRDTKGHAGPLLLEVAALAWIQQLYGVELKLVKAEAVKSESAKKILPLVASFNERFKQGN
ncbi:MAG: hypothetical protein AAF483_28550 [Planctomycetota bacterium]